MHRFTILILIITVFLGMFSFHRKDSFDFSFQRVGLFNINTTSNEVLDIAFSESHESRAITQLWAWLIVDNFSYVIQPELVMERLLLVALEDQKMDLTVTAELDQTNINEISINPNLQLLGQTIAPIQPGLFTPKTSPAEEIFDLNRYRDSFDHHIFYLREDSNWTPSVEQAIDSYQLNGYELNALSDQAFEQFVDSTSRYNKDKVFLYYEHGGLLRGKHFKKLRDPQKVFKEKKARYALGSATFETRFPGLSSFIQKLSSQEIDYQRYIEEYRKMPHYPELIIQKWVREIQSSR